MICARLDLEARWPHMFRELAVEELEIVRATVVSALVDGWQPDREDVADLIDEVRGVITSDEFLQRSYLRAHSIASRHDHPQGHLRLVGSVSKG